jgi:protein TonB
LAKVAVPPPVPSQKVRVPSAIVAGNLIHDVKPYYPLQARQGKIEGTVVLVAVIDKDGSVRDVQVKSGLPLLAQAAIEAVRQWRYKPYLLHGQPVEVDTQISINFTLS